MPDTIPARALTLPELEEVVRALVDLANDQRKFMVDLDLALSGAFVPKVSA